VKLSDILTEPQVKAELAARDKNAVLRELALHVSSHAGLTLDAEAVYAALCERERLGSTGVGEGVAIPHAKLPGIQQLVACFARSRQGVDFDAIDSQPVTLFVVLLVPENSAGAHLKALARVSRLLKLPAFRRHLLELPDGPAIYRAFLEEDAKH
jgi:PTS system nitrogen regulatory IIA component